MLVQFVVRYVNSLKDTIINVDSNAQIVKNMPTGFIRKEIRANYPDLNNRRLKLLHNGRVLQSHTDFSKEIEYLQKNLDDDDDDNNLNNKNNSDNRIGVESEEVVKIYFHCIVGEELNSKELAEEERLDTQPVKSTTEAPKGFDRLLSQGFSATDIEELRNQFFRLHGSSLPNNANAEQIRELEDRWIDSSVNHEIDEFPTNIRFTPTTATGTSTGDDNEDDYGNFNGSIGSNQNQNLNLNGNTSTTNNSTNNVREQMVQRDVQVHKEMLLGVCIGFALGGLALLLLFLDIGGIFGKKTRMALISGVVVNFSFGLFKSWTQ
jgi:hypothetical protein